MSDMTEIAAAKLGQERGNAQEKTFAAQMITDHTKTSEELKSMAPADAKAAIPTALDSSSQSKIDKLKDAKPDDFSSDFDSMQVSAHKDAGALCQGWRRSEAEGLGRQDPPGSPASSRDGAEPRQDEVTSRQRGDARKIRKAGGQASSGARAARSGGRSSKRSFRPRIQ
jgi:hypothetical protein